MKCSICSQPAEYYDDSDMETIFLCRQCYNELLKDSDNSTGVTRVQLVNGGDLMMITRKYLLSFRRLSK